MPAECYEDAIPTEKMNEWAIREIVISYQLQNVRIDILETESWLSNKKSPSIVKFPNLSKFFKLDLFEVTVMAEK